MKIAVVGKGGSGKSALTWLLAETAHAAGQSVYLIDADHNMDTAASYGITIDTQSSTLHRSRMLIRSLLGLTEHEPWKMALNKPSYPTPIAVTHPTIQHLWQKTVQPQLHVATVGLGSADILGSGMCAHGHSAALKWLLPCLTPTPKELLIIDGVAGTDMMNFGLFAGADVLLIVAEQHPNSERVAEQIRLLAEKTDLPIMVAGNRSTPNITYPTLGTLTDDIGIRTLQYHLVDTKNKLLAQQILTHRHTRPRTAMMTTLQKTSP